MFCLFVGNCSAGYYCPQGQTTDDPFLCTVGHFCKEGSASPTICPSGFYQDATGQSDCTICPEGYYCDNTVGIVVVNDTVKCPEGYYCPPGEFI